MSKHNFTPEEKAEILARRSKINKKEHNEMNKSASLKDRFKRIARSAGKGALVGGVAGAAGANPLHSARDLVRAADERSYRQGYSDMSHGEPTSLDNLSPRNRADHIKSGDKGYKNGKYSEPNINLQREELKLLMAQRDVHKKRTILTKAKSAMNGGAAGTLIGGALGAGRQAYKEIKDSRMNKEAALDLLSAARIAKNFRENNKKDAPRVSIKTKSMASKPNLRKSISTDPIEMVGRSAHRNFLLHRKSGGNQDNAKNIAEYQLGAERDKDISKFGRPSASLQSSSIPNQIGALNRTRKRRDIVQKMKNSGSSNEEIDRMHDRYDGRDDAATKREKAYSGSKSWIKNHSLTPLKKDHSNVIDITPKIEAKKQQEAAPQKKRSIRYHQLTESEKRSRAHHDPQMARENNNAVFYQTEGPSKSAPKSEPETKKRSIRHRRLSEDEKVNRIGKHPKYDSEYIKAHLHETEKDNSSFATGKSGLSTKQKLGIGGGVAATAGALYLANRYRKNRKAKREAEAGQNKIAALFDGSHEVNIGKDTRDWVDSKTKKMSDAAAKVPKMTSGVATKAKDAVSPHLTARNAAIGAGALAVYKGGKAIKRHIKNKMDDRAAKNKEDDRINYYKGQMDTHKDNAYMLRALTSRMSKEKFDA